ncbi:hypothetical protein LSAT2_031521 [Lamellibrachia satsuma]|nr:hypothetical protein LSAT2_031521 [Lamellibrachia satsuma]
MMLFSVRKSRRLWHLHKLDKKTSVPWWHDKPRRPGAVLLLQSSSTFTAVGTVCVLFRLLPRCGWIVAFGGFNLELIENVPVVQTVPVPLHSGTDNASASGTNSASATAQWYRQCQCHGTVVQTVPVPWHSGTDNASATEQWYRQCQCHGTVILKAVLQQQSMKVTNEDSDSVKATYQVSPPARTLVNRVGRSQTLVRSPVTLPTISVTSPVMMTSPSGASPSVMSPRLQVHDVDTSTPLKRSRSSSPEEDSDERRRKFLERNRAAAARCRAKKKMWIGGLEKKADDMQDVNARLQLEVTQLRNEVAELKSLLLAHKDCPITLQQRNAGRLTFTTVTPKVEPPDHPAMDISGATETSESTHDSVSHVTVTTSTVGSTSSQPIILNIMPLVQDGS